MFGIINIIVISYFIFFLISLIFSSKLPIFNLIVISSLLLGSVFLIFLRNCTVFKVRREIFEFLFLNFIVWFFLAMLFLITATIKGYNGIYILLSSLVSLKQIIFIVISLTVYICQKNFFNVKMKSLIFIAYFIVIISLLEFIAFKLNFESFFLRVERSEFSKNFYLFVGNLAFFKTFGIFRSPFENGTLLTTLFFLFLGLRDILFSTRFLFIVTEILLMLGIFLTFTRNVYLIFFFALIMFSFSEKLSLKKIFLFHAILLVFAPIIVYEFVFYLFPKIGIDFEFYQSIYTRLNTMLFLKDYIKDKLSILSFLFGFGISQINFKNPLGINDTSFAIDNLFVFLFLYSGFIGLSLFVFLYYYIAYLLLEIIKKTKVSIYRKLSQVSLSLWLSIPIAGLFNVVLGNIAIFGVIYYISLIAIVLAKCYRIHNSKIGFTKHSKI